MFKDTNEGSTHYQNDGCGEPAHNDIVIKEDPMGVSKWKEHGKKFGYYYYFKFQIKAAILNEMLAECDRTENESGRLLVQKFLNSMK